MKTIRRGKTVAVVGEHEGKSATLETKDYPSINAAKKANGLNSRTGKFPPTVNDYMMAEIPVATV